MCVCVCVYIYIYIWLSTGVQTAKAGGPMGGGGMVSLRSIVSLSVNLSIKNEPFCFSMESWIRCEISSTPNMVYDNGIKMVLNDTVPKKLTYIKTCNTVMY